ncbi:unnamed protein product, partial [Mesorhabditis spiculigera]
MRRSDLVPNTALVEVRDQNKHRLGRTRDQRLAVRDCAVDVQCPTKLSPERTSTGRTVCPSGSTTAVSKTTSEVFSACIDANTAPNTDA